MATTISSSSSSSSSSGANYAALAATATKSVAGEQPKRPYYGKCQYKTGKCFNERTLKRNGDAHSLCEEHRIKQNLIQRRSDRKYQTVHAIRRRERSQRRAVLKKQVSMAVAQQLFYEHQQQKSLGGLPLHLLANGLSPASPRNQPDLAAVGSIANPLTLVPPIQIPASSAPNMPFADANAARHVASAPASVLLPFPMARTAPIDSRNASFVETSAPFIKLEHPQQQQQQRAEAVGCKPGDESSPTSIDDFAPDSFLSISAEHAAPNGAHQCGGGMNINVDVEGAQDEDEDGDELDLGDDFAPIVSCRGERKLWTDEDIEFLQTLLLP